MKRFLKAILIFFVTVAVADAAFGFLCRYLNAHAGGGDTLNQYVTTKEQRSPILVLGSSRAAHHYNPEILADSLGKEVWNCGLDGNGLLFQYGRLLLILERYTPEVIIYDVIPSFDICEEDNLKSLKWLNRWADNHVLDTLINDVSRTERLKMLSNFYRYNTQFIQMLKENTGDPEIYDRGYRPLAEVMDYEGKGTDDGPTQWQPLKRKYFEKLIDLCREQGIKLVAVYSPWYGAKSSHALEPVTTMCSEKKVPVIDFYADTLWTARKEWFADPSHLNSTGADSFTRALVAPLRRALEQ